MELITVHVLKDPAEHVLNRAEQFPLSLIHRKHTLNKRRRYQIGSYRPCNANISHGNNST
jgi:hypothetical protein